MRVFVTGATGFIGTAIVKELLDAGHQVLGLSRSAASANKLKEVGAEVHPGDLQDLDSLRSGVSKADGVIHAGFIHDFTRYAEVCAVDKNAIETMGSVLKGSDRPIIITSGTALVSPGRLATEDMIAEFNPSWPRASEQAADLLSAAGINAGTLRLSPVVHSEGDLHGFIPILIKTAQEKGFSAYIGEGNNNWCAIHRLDAAKLFRLALEKGIAGARYHGAAEGSLQLKTIAGAIGRQLDKPAKSITPTEGAAHFDWFANMVAIDCPASNELTRETLGWQPRHPDLLTDISNGAYSAVIENL